MQIMKVDPRALKENPDRMRQSKSSPQADALMLATIKAVGIVQPPVVAPETDGGNGFTGSIRTLALNVKACIARVENPSDKDPQFRVYAGSVELGAAWQKTSEQGRDYLSVELDDPSFPAPIYAALAEVEGEDGLQLIWSRPNRD